MKRSIGWQPWVWVALIVAALLLTVWNQRRTAETSSRISDSVPTATEPGIGTPLPTSEPARPGGMRPRQDPYAGLPEQARQTIRLIRQGGPYPYRQDGSVFQNREGNLPQREYGYYREFTVATPGSSDRGARRIVSGGHPPREFWYTDNHYRSFERLPPQ